LPQHRHDGWGAAVLDLARDLETVVLVERHVSGIGRFEIGQHAVAIANIGDMSQQRAAE